MEPEGPAHSTVADAIGGTEPSVPTGPSSAPDQVFVVTGDTGRFRGRD